MHANRIAVALGGANLVLLAVLLGRAGVDAAGAESVAPVLRAELIELVDASGTMRAQFKTEDNGTVVLRLRDQDGTIRVKLAADRLGSALFLADHRAEVGVHLLSGISALTNQPDTMITLADPDGTKRVIRPGDGTP